MTKWLALSSTPSTFRMLFGVSATVAHLRIPHTPLGFTAFEKILQLLFFDISGPTIPELW